MNKDFFIKWRANFFAGLAVVLPGVVTLAVIFWLFFTASKITDTLLIFIPQEITHETSGGVAGAGPMHWYWSLVALAVAVVLTSVVGLLARNYLGQKMIEWVDNSLLRVPFLNKIYGATKQVNDAFTGNKSSFKTVVMIEFPRAGMYSIGFLTSEAESEIQCHTPEKVVCVFIPTTPNPTSGFMVLVPESQVTKLDMSVADGLKFIISLGAISPDFLPPHRQKITASN
ncbi:MAG TPA: DUF502 domain-containing protein [Verrucomicrobiae bacterium]|nr:DUF502 domain-containing protein [Verrucomicrobiae bacterium]